MRLWRISKLYFANFKEEPWAISILLDDDEVTVLNGQVT